MISKYTYKKLVWIDLESPTMEEVRSVCEEYEVPMLVGEEMLQKTYRSKADKYDNLIYLILHFPHMDGEKDKSDEKEIDFVIGHNFMITTRYEGIDPVHDFSKLFATGSVLDRGLMSHHAGFLFYLMARELYHHSMRQLEELNPIFKKIELGIYQDDEAKMVKYISDVNRKLLDFKQALRFHGDILKSFETEAKSFFGESFNFYSSSIVGEYNKVQSILEGHKDILHELRETNDSLLTQKTNDAIKTLTIMSFIMLPLTLISGIFGMNADFVFIHSIHDFFLVVAAMTLTGIAMFVYFKSKKWL